MLLKAKLRKIGNSFGVIIPKEVITYIENEWEVGVITDTDKYIDVPDGVITENREQGVITKDTPKVITPRLENTKKKKFVFNAKKGINEWVLYD